MSANAKNAATADVKANAEEKTVPAQKKVEKTLTAVEKVSPLVEDIAEALAKDPNQTYKVTLSVDENDGLVIQTELVEVNKIKTLAGKAKGVFQRNKKLVLATGALVATSVLLKVIARRNAELEDDEVVESSGEGIPLGNTGIVVDA